jgi:chemotaxis protein CheX
LDILEGDDARPVPDGVREQLLEPFIAAARLTLAEMAGTGAAVRAVYRTRQPRVDGDTTVMLGLTSGPVGALVLGFPGRTAAALAGRVLAGVVEGPDEGMVRDCMGEIANVLAGQAKALLLGTPYHFSLSTPTVLSRAEHEVRSHPEADCLVVAFASDVGDFALQLCLNR